MRSAAAPYRREERGSLRVPVVMPLVEVAVDDEGFSSVLLDREPYSADRSLPRDHLARVLEQIASDLGTPVRVEVHEADGSTFTDVITPHTPAPPEPSWTVPRAALASAFGVAGEGFRVGEEVAICVVVARQLADQDGTARLRLPPALLAAHPDVVLMGRTSGTVALSEGVA